MKSLRRAASEVASIVRADTPTHRHLRERLTALILVTIALDVVCTVLAYFFERHVANSDIQTLGSALFWTSSQLLTVSSSMSNPLSAAGRVLDVLIEIYAITVVATLAGSFGSFFHRRGHERDAERELGESRR